MKNKKLGYIIVLIGFILFNAIAFIFPTNRTITFWVAYAFTVLAFLVQIFICNLFKNNETLKNNFLNFPIVYISSSYLIIQLIAFILFMLFPFVSPWIVIIFCSFALAALFICLLTTELGLGEVKKIEEKVHKETMFIKNIQTDIELILNEEKDIDTKKALTKLIEVVRYSDPISDESLNEIEAKISKKILGLKNSNDKMSEINEINSLFVERNKKIKINKQ